MSRRRAGSSRPPGRPPARAARKTPGERALRGAILLGAALVVAYGLWLSLPDRGPGFSKARVAAKITGNAEENGNYLIRWLFTLRRPEFIPDFLLAGVTLDALDPAILHVTGPEGLYNAMNLAEGWETILLAPGEYGDFYFEKAAWAAPGLRLRSEDPDDPARFSSLKLKRLEHLTLERVRIDFRPRPQDPRWSNALWIVSSRDLRISGVAIRGVPPPVGRGIYVTRSRDIRILDNDIARFQRGVLALNSSGRVAGNRLAQISMRAIQVRKGKNGVMVIEDNRIDP